MPDRVWKAASWWWQRWPVRWLWWSVRSVWHFVASSRAQMSRGHVRCIRRQSLRDLQSFVLLAPCHWPVECSKAGRCDRFRCAPCLKSDWVQCIPSGCTSGESAAARPVGHLETIVRRLTGWRTRSERAPTVPLCLWRRVSALSCLWPLHCIQAYSWCPIGRGRAAVGIRCPWTMPAIQAVHPWNLPGIAPPFSSQPHCRKRSRVGKALSASPVRAWWAHRFYRRGSRIWQLPTHKSKAYSRRSGSAGPALWAGTTRWEPP